jgi:hypothetical protein
MHIRFGDYLLVEMLRKESVDPRGGESVGCSGGIKVRVWRVALVVARVCVSHIVYHAFLYHAHVCSPRSFRFAFVHQLTNIYITS